MSKYKIEGVGLDTTNLDYVADVGDFDYLHTSISSNNGFIIRDILDESIATIITSIDFLDQCKFAIINHLNEINRDRIDLLLINSSCDFEKYSEEIEYLLDNNLVDQVGIKNPNSPEEIIRIMKIIPKIKYISLELCPLNFNYEVIDWCDKNNIDILVFNPLGDYITSPLLIDSFTIPYLLNFAAYYGIIVFLSGGDISANTQRSYLLPLVGLDIENDNIYKMNKSVRRLIKPLKKAVTLSLRMDDNITLPFTALQSSLFSSSDLIFNLSNNVEYKISGIEDDDISSYIKDKLKSDDEYKLPSDSGRDIDIISVLRFYISGWLGEILGMDRYIASCIKLSSNIFVYLIYSIDSKKKKIKYNPDSCYLLYKSGDNIQFLNIKNAIQKP